MIPKDSTTILKPYQYTTLDGVVLVDFQWDEWITKSSTAIHQFQDYQSGNKQSPNTIQASVNVKLQDRVGGNTLDSAQIQEEPKPKKKKGLKERTLHQARED